MSGLSVLLAWYAVNPYAAILHWPASGEALVLCWASAVLGIMLGVMLRAIPENEG